MIEVESPVETVDIVAPEIRDYMSRAKDYQEGDYSYTVKTNDDLGNTIEPVKFSWRFKNDANIKSCNIILSTDKSFKETVKIIVPKINTPVSEKLQVVYVYNLYPETTYYWHIESVLQNNKTNISSDYSFTTSEGPRILRIDGVHNARDVGGYNTTDGKKTKYGMIYRSANLNNITDEGIKTVLNEFGVKTELDLRNYEKDEIFNPLKFDLNYINITGKSYSTFWDNEYYAQQVFKIFANPDNYPIIVHCNAGADRTGIVIFMLGALCGVSENDLIIDYEITPRRLRKGIISGQYNYDFPKFITAFRSKDGANLQEKAYNYLKNSAGLSVMEIYNIKALMTGETAVFKDPPHLPPEVKNGYIEFPIDCRNSGNIKKVVSGNKEYDFSFENDILKINANAGEVINATVHFEDGTEMPIVWN